MSRESKLVKNTIILAIGTFFPKFVIFITLPILTAYLTQEEYGTYDLVQTLVAMVLPAATLQIHSAAFRFLIDVNHDENSKKRIISNIYGFVLPTSMAALLIMYFALQGLGISIRLAICVYFFFDIIVNANRQIIRGLSRNEAYTFSAFISAVGQIVLIVALVMGFKRGLFGAVIALATAEAIASTYLLIKGGIYRYIDFRQLSIATLRELLEYSWPMVPNSLAQWVMRAADRVIITFFLGVSQNAVFAVANKIPSILSFAQTTFNMAWQENASIVSKDADVANYYSSMFRYLFDIVSGCMSIILGFTPILFALLVNGDYAQAYNHMPILFMGMFFLCLSTFWGGIFVAYKKTKAVGATTVIAALIHLLVVLVGIKHFALYAASVATVVSYAALCCFRLIGICKIVKIQYGWRHIIIVTTILTFQCMICFQQNYILDVVNFLVGIAFGLTLNKQLVGRLLKKFTRMDNRN